MSGRAQKILTVLLLLSGTAGAHAQTEQPNLPGIGSAVTQGASLDCADLRVVIDAAKDEFSSLAGKRIDKRTSAARTEVAEWNECRIAYSAFSCSRKLQVRSEAEQMFAQTNDQIKACLGSLWRQNEIRLPQIWQTDFIFPSKGRPAFKVSILLPPDESKVALVVSACGTDDC